MTEPLSKSWCRMIKHRKEKVKMIQFRNDEHKAAYDDLMQGIKNEGSISASTFSLSSGRVRCHCFSDNSRRHLRILSEDARSNAT